MRVVLMGGSAYCLIAVGVVVAVIVRSVADALDVPAVPATIVEWSCAVAAGAGAWRWWRRFRRELASERLVEERAAGEALRHEHPDRYRDFINGASQTLAATDPDRFVGQQEAAEPREEEEPREELRIRSQRWKAATSQQTEAVDRLTKQLGRATLIRTLTDGSAELVGTKQDVGFRYRVESSGGVTLLSEDHSLVTSNRQARRAGRAGLLAFVGSCAVPALGPNALVSMLLLPFTIVGFLLLFLFLAGASGAKQFLKEGEWYEYGKGWD
jgi:hypothetical protein